jgi:hypothetical protein
MTTSGLKVSTISEWDSDFSFTSVSSRAEVTPEEDQPPTEDPGKGV